MSTDRIVYKIEITYYFLIFFYICGTNSFHECRPDSLSNSHNRIQLLSNTNYGLCGVRQSLYQRHCPLAITIWTLSIRFFAVAPEFFRDFDGKRFEYCLRRRRSVRIDVKLCVLALLLPLARSCGAVSSSAFSVFHASQTEGRLPEEILLPELSVRRVRTVLSDLKASFEEVSTRSVSTDL